MHQARKALSDRGSQAHYDGAHKRLRLECFRRDRWVCVKCGWRPRIVREFESFPALGDPIEAAILEELARAYKRGENHLQCDHIIPIPVREDLAGELTNLQTLCRDCHAAKTGKVKRAVL